MHAWKCCNVTTWNLPHWKHNQGPSFQKMSGMIWACKLMFLRMGNRAVAHSLLTCEKRGEMRNREIKREGKLAGDAKERNLKKNTLSIFSPEKGNRFPLRKVIISCLMEGVWATIFTLSNCKERPGEIKRQQSQSHPTHTDTFQSLFQLFHSFTLCNLCPDTATPAPGQERMWGETLFWDSKKTLGGCPCLSF